MFVSSAKIEKKTFFNDTFSRSKQLKSFQTKINRINEMCNLYKFWFENKSSKNN